MKQPTTPPKLSVKPQVPAQPSERTPVLAEKLVRFMERMDKELAR